jgi:branched-chain amino acid transport system permease protein
MLAPQKLTRMQAAKRSGGIWAGLVVLLALPFLLDSFYLFVASLALAYAIAALGFSLLVGSSGQISLAHAVPFAIGAYAVAVGAAHRVDVWLSLLAGIALSAIISLVAGFVTLRLSEFYFALATIGLVVVTQNILSTTTFTGGTNGISAPPITFITTGRGQAVDQYFAVAVLAILAGLATRNLNGSFIGRAFNGIRDIPSAAASCGVPVFRTKLMAFTVSSVYATVAGAVYGGLVTVISPDQFGFNLILLFLAILIVGGRASIPGAFVGAAAFTYLPQVLQPAQGAQNLIFGLAIMLTMLLAPDGLWPAGARLLKRGALLVLSRFDTALPQPSLELISMPSTVPAHAEALAPEASPRAGMASPANQPQVATALAPAHPVPGEVRQQPPRLSVTGLSKAFGGVPAVADVSLQLHHRGVLALIGPNGSGKTTLLNCITRILPADSGTIYLDGSDITRLSANQVAARGIRRTFQSPQLVSGRTVLENVMLGAHLDAKISIAAALVGRTLTGRRERATEDAARQALEILGLSRYASMPVGAVEGPTQKLIEVARCMAGKPRVMLFDEIASGINSFEKSYLAERIDSLRTDHDVSIILVEHDLDFVTKVADSMVVLQSGGVIAEGLPSLVLAAKPVREAYFGA